MGLKYHGKGNIYYPNGNIFYSGIFEGGKINGPCKIYDPNGFMIFDGHIYDNNEILIDGTNYSSNEYHPWNYELKSTVINESNK